MLFLEPLLLGVLRWGLEGPVAAGVFPAEVDVHEDREDQGHGVKAKQGAVARNVARSVLLQVEEGRDGAAEVAEADVHGDTDTTLERAADVVSVPCDTLGHVGVDTRSQEEAAGVLDGVGVADDEHH